jgi:hypothetical protein
VRDGLVSADAGLMAGEGRNHVPVPGTGAFERIVQGPIAFPTSADQLTRHRRTPRETHG